MKFDMTYRMIWNLIWCTGWYEIWYDVQGDIKFDMMYRVIWNLIWCAGWYEIWYDVQGDMKFNMMYRVIWNSISTSDSTVATDWRTVQVALGLIRGYVSGITMTKKNRCKMNIIVPCMSLGSQWFAFQAPFKTDVSNTIGIIILLKFWNKCWW